MREARDQAIKFSIEITTEFKGNLVERAQGPTIEFSIEISAEVKGNVVEFSIECFLSMLEKALGCFRILQKASEIFKMPTNA